MVIASTFDATPAFLGYMHQLRYALWQAIEASRLDIRGIIAIEAADDVELQTENIHSVDQLKHRNKESTLSDRSSDLWKTLRIWSSLIDHSTFDTSNVHFRLITTGVLGAGSTASMLAVEERNEEKALERLRKISGENNKSNQPAYTAFRELSPRQQSELVSRIEVIADAPDIQQVREKIEKSLAVGFPRKHLKTFVQHLEGWWFDVCINKLTSSKDKFIQLDQLDSQIYQLRQEFGEDNLPISRKISRMKPPTMRYQNHNFVKQLHFIKIGESRVNRAITNYLKAFVQRSSWQRENLLLSDELQDYEDALVEEWEIYFDQLTDEMGENASEEAKLSVAKELYAWAETATSPVIRERCTEPFIIRGSFHILAHDNRIGWHPEFAARLMTLLAPKEEVEAE